MRPRRLDATQYVGPRQYFLTVCAFQRRQLFKHSPVVDDVAACFVNVAASEGLSIDVYCFMPDHVHLLATAQADAADFQRFVKLAKQRSGFAFKQATGERLWQDSYFDRTLRDNEPSVEVIGYIIANPVRAGLVQTPAQYPYWGSQIYSREEIIDFISIESRRV
jgi:putative transposase